MKRNLHVFIYIFSLCVLLTGCNKRDNSRVYPTIRGEQADSALVSQLLSANWERKQVAPGILWMSNHFTFANLDDVDLEDPNLTAFNKTRQYVTIFDIDLNRPDIKIEIPYVTFGTMTTSAAAEANNADIAFNGSFFDENSPGSAAYLKVNGKVITETMGGLASYLENGAFYLAKADIARIMRKPTAGWTSSVSYNIVAAGPMLIDRGKKATMSTAAFNTGRQARTAVGITARNHLIVVVVDGGTVHSEGMSTTEMVELMLALGCIDALNLAGGNLSTAWVKDHGIVNHPAGNGRFDHEGEAGTGTAFTIKYTK